VWGSGWPNCQGGRLNRDFYVDTAQGRIEFRGGIRNEIAELVSRLVRETVNRGYRIGAPGNPSYGCWGYNCRAIDGTSKPSNHSWGLAVDINAPTNPKKRPLTTNMPRWMPDLWSAYGFRWGGDYTTTPDAMHYEYMGSIQDAAAHTQIAQNNRLGEGVASDSPTEPTLKRPTTRKDTKMYCLMQGDATAEWWLTDFAWKRHMRDAEEAEFYVYVIRANGGICATNKDGGPQPWPQRIVDKINRCDANETDETWSWYAAAKSGPAHEVIKQATGG
jgi:hypothetical protein